MCVCVCARVCARVCVCVCVCIIALLTHLVCFYLLIEIRLGYPNRLEELPPKKHEKNAYVREKEADRQREWKEVVERGSGREIISMYVCMYVCVYVCIYTYVVCMYVVRCVCSMYVVCMKMYSFVLDSERKTQPRSSS